MSRLPSEIRITQRVRIPAAEIELAYVRASGPGGQHVNKTSSKVQLRFNIDASVALNDQDRELLRKRLRLTQTGDLLLSSDRYRDQSRNVEDALARLEAVLRAGLVRPKPRKKTRPTRASKERRLSDKKRQSQRKRERRGE